MPYEPSWSVYYGPSPDRVYRQRFEQIVSVDESDMLWEGPFSIIILAPSYYIAWVVYWIVFIIVHTIDKVCHGFMILYIDL
jgi:hypothetical protein